MTIRLPILAGLLLTALAAAPSAAAAPVTLNLKNADIKALIASVSEITGRNFIVDPRVNARVTVISAKPMEEEEIYQVFLAILAVHGFAAIPGDKVTKIVPEANAKQDDIPTVGQRGEQEDDQVVTRVIQVQNVSAAQIVPILRPLIPPQGHLAAYAPTNVLIVSDRAGNVERIANIISRVDLASTEDVEIIPLRYASATDVVQVLSALEQGRARTDPAAAVSPPRLVADERTNSLLMSGDPATRLRLRTLISHLDTPLETGGNTQVIYLRYANAADLVPVLQGVSQELAAGEPGAAPAQPGQPPPPPVSGPRGQPNISIQADESTNSLVVTAPAEIIRSLKSVIAQLDIRRAQVLVEAAIVELTSTRTAELGVQWVVDAGAGNGPVGIINFATGLSAANVLNALTAATPSVPANLPSGAFLGAGDFTGSTRFAALINALATDSDANVLSTPTLVTLDNEEAEIVVGQNVPFVTGSFTTDTNVSTNPFQTIQREDVGLTLRIKPQINEGNAVKLEISQEVSSVLSTDPQQGPTTRQREIRTTVLVEDGQILVLGGLIEDTYNDSVQKVPGLGDIPVLGNLFKFRDTTKTKQNLMVFLHPVILRDPSQGTLHTNDKYSYIRAQQLAARQPGFTLLPGAASALLPTPDQVYRQKSLRPLTNGEAAAPPPAAPRPAGAPRPLGLAPPAPIDTLGFNES